MEASRLSNFAARRNLGSGRSYRCPSFTVTDLPGHPMGHLTYFTTQTFEYPLVEGVKTPSLLVPLERLNIPDVPAGNLADLAETQQLLKETGVLP